MYEYLMFEQINNDLNLIGKKYFQRKKNYANFFSHSIPISKFKKI